MSKKGVPHTETLERLFQEALSKVDWVKLNHALEVEKSAQLGVSIYVTGKRLASYMAVQYKATDETDQ